jgi:hypothetical protein
MKRLFYTAFDESMSVARSESSAAVVVGRVLNFGTKRRYNIVRTDREADYMCFSPLRRKTSELEGEEYTIRIVSGIDRLDPPLVSQQSFHTSASEKGESEREKERERERRERRRTPLCSLAMPAPAAVRER